MEKPVKKRDTRLKILLDDPSLAPYEGDLNARVQRYKARKKQLLAPGQTLSEFASGHLYYGFHKEKGGWVYREWAPGATAMHLVGDFNNWNRESHPMTSLGNGDWEIHIPGVRTLRHLSRVKVCVTSPRGTEDRIPLYATYVTQDKTTNSFSATIWNPRKTFEWTDEKFRPKKNVPPLIYEAHVGMATEEERVGTYLEFMRDMLPRIKRDGYNTVQLMAIMEHPYYASFGYQVSNFFAASSWYGTPDDLKALVNEAHRLGLPVAAHVESTEGVKVALENGVDTIEHGAKPDDEMIGLFKARSASHIATISPALPFALFDRSIIGATEVQQYNGRIVFDGIIDCAKACLENGIPVGLGTDTGCPYITHYDMWREVYYFHKYCGVSNAFALHTATLGNAEILGMEDELGSIAPGKCADLIVTAANPLDDLKALRNVSMVVARGEIVDISGLKKYPAVEHELNKFLD